MNGFAAGAADDRNGEERGCAAALPGAVGDQELARPGALMEPNRPSHPPGTNTHLYTSFLSKPTPRSEKINVKLAVYHKVLQRQK